MKNKKIISIMAVMLSSLVIGTNAFATNIDNNNLGTEETIEISDKNHSISPFAVSVSPNFNLAVGKSWSLSGIKMGVAFHSPHNAMNVQVKNVTGKYKIIIKSTKGYNYESGQKTGNFSVSINTDNTQDYTVYVVNTGSSKCTGKVYVSSYYK